MKVLVYALDSVEGEAACRRGIEEARTREAGLILATYVRVDSEGNSPDRSVAAAQQRLDDLVQAARDRGVVEAEGKVLLGMQGAAQALLDLAATIGAALLVIGIRRRTRVGKLVLGSVSQELLLGADCPVLAVKDTDED